MLFSSSFFLIFTPLKNSVLITIIMHKKLILVRQIYNKIQASFLLMLLGSCMGLDQGKEFRV